VKTGRTGRFVKKAHDDLAYKKRRKLLMATITPATRCGKCGKLFHEHPRHKNGKPGRWETGHVLDAVTHGNLGPLQIEHSVCNRKAGGALGLARRNQRAAAATNGRPSQRAVETHWPGHFDLNNPKGVGAPPCVRQSGRLCAVCLDFRQRNPRTL
jgi:hypothetical protein